MTSPLHSAAISTSIVSLALSIAAPVGNTTSTWVAVYRNLLGGFDIVSAIVPLSSTLVMTPT